MLPPTPLPSPVPSPAPTLTLKPTPGPTILCEPGHSFDHQNNLCVPCLTGTYMGNGTAPWPDKCYDCPAGRIQIGIGQTSCSECPPGKLSFERITCMDCEQGQYEYNDQSCNPCAAGKYAPSALKDDCLTCQGGFVFEVEPCASCSPMIPSSTDPRRKPISLTCLLLLYFLRLPVCSQRVPSPTE